jgi:hypothetical protein
VITASPMPVRVESFRYLAECNTFPDWITLFTLCLAPLIAHVASGTPTTSYLTSSRPKFIDILCHYNPTSIIWRYAAIVDRRLRATKWSPNDLAATNAIFWTTNGWNGDESMVTSSMPYRVQVPQKTHVQVFSVTMLKTIIVSLQGVSAMYSLIGGLTGSVSKGGLSGLGVDTVFFPLASLGLLRLCAAAWLSEDFAYLCPTNSPREPFRHNTLKEVDVPLITTADDLDPWLTTPLTAETYFRAPNSSWSSCAFRAFYLLICTGLCIFALIFALPWVDFYSYYSVTSLLVGLFYSIFFSISSVIYAVYFVRGRTTTTIIPCISSLWYKAYTVLLMATMVIMVTIAAIQTNQLPNGAYTSYAQAVQLDCKSQMTWWGVSPQHAFSGDIPQHAFSGVMSMVPKNVTAPEANASGILATRVSNGTSILDGIYLLSNFTGYCVGRLGGT